MASYTEIVPINAEKLLNFSYETVLDNLLVWNEPVSMDTPEILNWRFFLIERAICFINVTRSVGLLYTYKDTKYIMFVAFISPTVSGQVDTVFHVALYLFGLKPDGGNKRRFENKYAPCALDDAHKTYNDLMVASELGIISPIEIRREK
jgi:hypothetical protein